MKQVWVTKKGGPHVLQVREVAEPQPGAGEIRVQVKAAGVNFADNLIRMGLYPGAPKPPMVPGFEVAGIVDKLGSGARGFREGDRVMAILPTLGGYSEKVVLPAALAASVPRHLSDEQAGAVPVIYATAWMMLVRLANVQPGEMVLIHSAGGGVGLAAVQIAKWRGARIIGSASTHKHARLKEMGCEHCIDYHSQDVELETIRLTGGHGADVILDPNGGRSFARSYRSLAAMGRLVIYGVSSFAPGKTMSPIAALKGVLGMPRFKPLDMLGQNKSVLAFWLGRPGLDPNKVRAELGQALKLIEQKVLDPIVDRAFRFEQAAEAHHYMQDHRNFGKLVLTP